MYSVSFIKSKQHTSSYVDQWFQNFIAQDPKEKLNVWPGTNLVKIVDLQAHNASLCAVSLYFLNKCLRSGEKKNIYKLTARRKVRRSELLDLLGGEKRRGVECRYAEYFKIFFDELKTKFNDFCQ